MPKSISDTLRPQRLFRDGEGTLLIWAIVAYILLVPSLSLVPYVGPYNEKRSLQIGLLIIVGCVLFLSSTYRQQWLAVLGSLPTLACWGLCSVLGLGAISSVLAPAPQAAFLELGHFVLLFVTAGVIASAVRRARKQTERLLLGAITIGVLLYAVYFIVGYGVSLTLPALQIGRDTIGGFVNTRFFNQYQTWTLPLLGGSFLALPKSWRIGRGLVFFLIALWWTLVLGSDVRGTVVAMAIGALGVTLLFQNRSYPWLGLQGAALLAGGILYYFLFTLGACRTFSADSVIFG